MKKILIILLLLASTMQAQLLDVFGSKHNYSWIEQLADSNKFYTSVGDWTLHGSGSITRNADSSLTYSNIPAELNPNPYFEFDYWEILFTGNNFQLQNLQGVGLITVDWGDNTSNDYTLTGSDQTITHTYASSQTYSVKVYNYFNLTKLYMNNNAGVWVLNTSKLTSLTYLYLYNLNTTGTTITFNSQYHSSLTTLYLYNLNTTGTVITFNSQYHNSLTYLYLNALNTTGTTITFNSQYHSSLTDLYLYNLNTTGTTITFNSQYHNSLTYLILYNLNTTGTTITFNSQYHNSLTYLSLYSLNTTGTVITFNSQYHSSLTYLSLYSLNTTGTVITFNSQYHNSLTTLFLNNLNTTGTTITFNSQYHNSLTYLYLNNLNTTGTTITFNSQYHNSLTYLYLNNLNTTGTDLTYTSITFTSTMQRFYVDVGAGGFTSCEIDQLYADLSSVTTWTGSKELTVIGSGNEQRTTASDANKATIISKGVTVTDNGNTGTCP